MKQYGKHNNSSAQNSINSVPVPSNFKPKPKRKITAMMKFKKLNNVSEAHCREFQRRIRGLDKEVRPIIKILSKDVTERVRFENDALLDHFIKL